MEGGSRDGGMRGMVTRMSWDKKDKASAIWSPPSWWVRDHPGLVLFGAWTFRPAFCIAQ